MNHEPIPHDELDAIWDDVFSPDDKVLWVGRPDHGRNFWEFEGQEHIYYRSMVVGGIVIWLAGLLSESFSRDTAILKYIILFLVTAGGFAVFWYMASSRAYVMSNLFYAVTQDCAFVVRRGGNFRTASRRYVLSFPFEARYAFPIYPGRKFGSIQVGSLLGENTVQPFGFGLTHPGWPVGRAVGIVPALFESIENAEEMQVWFQDLADKLHH